MAHEIDGVEVCCCAGAVEGGPLVGSGMDEPVTPASVLKIQVALTALAQIASGRLDGTRRVTLAPERRTPGPVGVSLLTDPVEMSVRDLVVPTMTVSDNVTTDALIGLLGLDAINATTRALGLERTLVVDDLADLLDGVARDCGFADYAALAAHEPATDGPPSDDEVRALIACSAALDPRRGSRTTPAETVTLLRAIWADAADPAACAGVRRLMGQQLTRHRIAAGFPGGTRVAAKSGGLLGIVRNEAGVVEWRGRSYAVAVFTRRVGPVDGPTVDAGIGRVARELVEELAG